MANFMLPNDRIRPKNNEFKTGILEQFNDVHNGTL
jgi:hypothetical protein